MMRTMPTASAMLTNLVSSSEELTPLQGHSSRHPTLGCHLSHPTNLPEVAKLLMNHTIILLTIWVIRYLINQRHDLTNRNRLVSASTHAALPRSRLQAAWQHKRHRPTAVLPEQTLSGVPVQRTSRQELRKSAVLPCLASVAAPAQPAQVIQGERPQHRRWA